MSGIGVPVVAQRKQIWLTAMRMQVRFLASFSGLSGLRIWYCSELWCSLQMRLGSGVVMAVVQAGGYSSNLTPSLRISVCCRCGPKKTEKKKKSGVARDKYHINEDARIQTKYESIKSKDIWKAQGKHGKETIFGCEYHL